MVDSDGGGSDYAEAMAATPVDINEYSNSYAFVIDMPGLKAGDVRVQVKANNVLFISSQRPRVEAEGAKCLRKERSMKFMRKFALPETANTDNITVVSTDGVVTVTVEKLPQPKTIEAKREEALESYGDERQLKVAAVDRISLLPNELLVRVLCLLNLKEATTTSILSRSWRYLHTFTTKLDFDRKKCKYNDLDKVEYNDLEKKEVGRKYIQWVDGVIGSNKSSCLEEFRLFLPLSRKHARHIDKWVKFALSRRVESLVLVFMDDGDYIRQEEENNYALNLHKLQIQYHDYYKLRRFCTYGVNVRGEGVEMLLGNCPLLEQVSVALSAHLLSLDIQKPYPSFKRLEISWCWELTSVVVRDSNIESIKYMGLRVNWLLVDVPYFTEIWVGGCTYLAADVVQMFLSVLPQLHMFKIRLQGLKQ